MKRIIYLTVVTLVILGTMHVYTDVNKSKDNIQLKTIQLKDTQAQLNKVEQNYNALSKDKNATDRQKTDLQKQIDDLNNQLQSKAELKKQAVVYAAAAPVTAVEAGISDSDAKAYIYAHESGNNPTAQNSIGCLGLGQACPGEKLLAVCPTLEYGCEDTFFTNYALARYGSWQIAYQHWLNFRWW